jgi:flagellar motor switch protein FliM
MSSTENLSSPTTIEQHPGLKMLVDSARLTYEKLPMLEIILDKLVGLLTSSLRNFTSVMIDVNFANIGALRFGEYLNSLRIPSMLHICTVPKWGSSILLSADSNLAYAVINILLGGKNHQKTVERPEPRPYTAIEGRLLERFTNIVLADFNRVFHPLTGVEFRYDRQESIPRFATIVQANNAVVLASLKIMVNGQGGNFDFVIPYSTIEPVRETLLQMYVGEKFGQDSIWENHLTKEAWAVEIPLQAFLAEIELPLEEVLQWKKGTFLNLNKPLNTLISVKNEDTKVFEGSMGNYENYLAIKIEKTHLNSLKAPPK